MSTIELEMSAGVKKTPRLFVFNFTTGSVSAAYGTVIVLAIAFAIAAIGGLLYHGLQSMATGGYAYGQDTYNYKR